MGAFLLQSSFFPVHTVVTFRIQGPLNTHTPHLTPGQCWRTALKPLLSLVVQMKKCENTKIKMHLSNNPYSNLRRRLGPAKQMLLSGLLHKAEGTVPCISSHFNHIPLCFCSAFCSARGLSLCWLLCAASWAGGLYKGGLAFFVPRFDHSAHMKGKKALSHKGRLSSPHPTRRWDIRKARTGPHNSS